MKHSIRVVSSLVILYLAGCSGTEEERLPYFNSPDFTPEWNENKSADSIHRIPAFSFLDQDSLAVNERALEGKISVANFFFTVCPGICPRLTTSMQRIQNEFIADQDVLLLSHSVMPDFDNVTRLKEYAEIHKVRSGKWHLLTGNRSEIYTLARQGYFADEEFGYNKGDSEFLHTENLILTDRNRRIRGVYNGTNPTEVERLIEDIKILKHEK